MLIQDLAAFPNENREVRPKMPKIRPFLLSLPERLQTVIVVWVTVTAAFAVALASRMLFDVQQLQANTQLIVATYEVFGTIYAMLLAFVVSGSWQNFSTAVKSVQAEAAALSDLVHIVDIFPGAATINFRGLAGTYAQMVIQAEWRNLAAVARGDLSLQDLNLDASNELIQAVQFLEPANSRESVIFEQALVMLNNWLDARRLRLQSAGGGNAATLWPLLITGALVLFGFHGLFVAHSPAVWTALLLGLSIVVGLAFYLILSLNSPFTGTLSVHVTPFQWLIHWCQKKQPPVPNHPDDH
jgi:hypothetical protein